MDLFQAKKIHFVGIGGIGVSAAARILMNRGVAVSGSDERESEITEQLAKEGARIFIGHRAENLPPDADLLVYTVAVPAENPERKRAADFGVAQKSYPELLGLLMKDKIGIGISGTDGKTTTTAMLGKIFLDAGLDPTIVVGSKVGYLGGNSRVGQSDYFIFESDEYRRAFENYFPKAAIITNIAKDHLDCFADLDDIKAAFSSYLKKLPEDGLAIINADDENTRAVSDNLRAKKITYGIETEADLMAEKIICENGRQNFSLRFSSRELGEISLPLPARYNVYNALAAICAALAFGVEFSVIKKTLSEFGGVWRRFERLGKIGTTEVITDYAHTPYAVRQTIEAIKDFFPGKKILFVFQPHQYSRTKNLFNEFAVSFNAADEAILVDVFSVKGREDPADFEFDSRRLSEQAAQNGAKVIYGGDLNQTEKIIRDRATEFDAIVLMGAGDIYGLAKKIVS